MSCRRTLRWTPFSQCSLATSRCAANNLFILALALDIHVFCLRAETEGAILHTTFEECAPNLAFHVGGANASLWLRLCWTFALQNVGGSEWVRSQKRLGAWRRKDWHGLHESSHCYFRVYAGTRNLNVGICEVEALKCL